MNQKQKDLEKARAVLAQTEKNIEKFNEIIAGAEKIAETAGGLKTAGGERIAEKARKTIVDAVVGAVSSEIHRKKIIRAIAEIEKDVE
jgi:hypothetical protein